MMNFWKRVSSKQRFASCVNTIVDAGALPPYPCDGASPPKADKTPFDSPGFRGLAIRFPFW
jgi:hypothetical protein